MTTNSRARRRVPADLDRDAHARPRHPPTDVLEGEALVHATARRHHLARRAHERPILGPVAHPLRQHPPRARQRDGRIERRVPVGLRQPAPEPRHAAVRGEADSRLVHVARGQRPDRPAVQGDVARFHHLVERSLPRRGSELEKKLQRVVFGEAHGGARLGKGQRVRVGKGACRLDRARRGEALLQTNLRHRLIEEERRSSRADQSGGRNDRCGDTATKAGL